MTLRVKGCVPTAIKLLRVQQRNLHNTSNFLPLLLSRPPGLAHHGLTMNKHSQRYHSVVDPTSSSSTTSTRALTDINSITMTKAHLSKKSRKVELHFSDNGTATKFQLIWLRDHCKCPDCFHPKTLQRLYDTHEIPFDIKAKEVSLSDDSKQLNITWEDGHKSLYGVKFLRESSYDPRLPSIAPPKSKKHFWAASLLSNLPTVEFKAVMETNEGLAQHLKNIDVYGISFIKDTPATAEATEKLAERIAFIRETHFGKFWDFTGKTCSHLTTFCDRANLAHNDTAYTTLGMHPHTDNTYFTDPSGLQMFHLLEFDGVGGQSVFVDGFAAAEKLKKSNPEAYELLKTLSIGTHSAGDDTTLVTPAPRRYPIFNIDPLTNELYQIRFNNDDRSSLSYLKPNQVIKFYKALHAWATLLRDKENELVVPLQPGFAVIFDNWRVLHGRKGFSGHRRLAGAYINRDDYNSRLATITKHGVEKNFL